LKRWRGRHVLGQDRLDMLEEAVICSRSGDFGRTPDNAHRSES
jgi:hypothetical protein